MTKGQEWRFNLDDDRRRSGNIGYYRIYDASETVCHEQRTVTATGGGGDITVDNVTIAIGQALTITGKTITAGNA